MKKNVTFILTLIFSAFLFGQTVDLTEKARNSGMSFYWDPLTYTGMLEKNGHRISFRAGDSFCLKDYKTIINQEAPKLSGSKLVATSSFISTAENFFKTEKSDAAYQIGAILIDPGHGGKDPGASYSHKSGSKNIKVVEKDINLSVGLKLYDYLKKAYPEKQILMTRNTDTFISLSQRTEIANSVKLRENEAILYVSVHVNASIDTSANGYEVWYLTPSYRRQVLSKTNEDKSVLPILNSMMEEEYTTESKLIAKFIMDGMGAQVGSQASARGIKAEEWFVCRNANMPSVLIELGFLTNRTEGLLLADDKYLQKLSFGIYNGLQAFVTHFERSRGFTGR